MHGLLWLWLSCVCMNVLGGPQGLRGLFRGGADLTPLLKNKRLVDVQLRCVQDAGPCDGFGNLLKVAVTEVLSNNCRTCTPQQRSSANNVLDFIRTNYPAQYRQLYNIYTRQQRPAG